MEVQPTGEPPGETPPPGLPRRRRYWGYVDRPYRGFGCLWSVLFFLLMWLLLSMVFPPGVIWRPYWL